MPVRERHVACDGDTWGDGRLHHAAQSSFSVRPWRADAMDLVIMRMEPVQDPVGCQRGTGTGACGMWASTGASLNSTGSTILQRLTGSNIRTTSRRTVG